jgi:phosphoserine phosphatase
VLNERRGLRRSGSFSHVRAEAPTSRAGGKARVAGALKDGAGYDLLAVVGDGATDMEARPPADVFVGYGGIVEREAVMKGADWFIRDFDDMLAVLRQ